MMFVAVVEIAGYVLHKITRSRVTWLEIIRDKHSVWESENVLNQEIDIV